MNSKRTVGLAAMLCVTTAFSAVPTLTFGSIAPIIANAQETYTEVVTDPKGSVSFGNYSLNYGFGPSGTLQAGTIASDKIQLSKPNVYIINQNGQIINHIWGSQNSSSNFLLGFMKDDTGTNYDIFSSPGLGGKIFVTKNDDGSVDRIKGVVEKEIPNYGKVEFTTEQYPSGTSGIMHSTTIKNTGDKPLKFVYMKSVDTDLAGNDYVPVFMYGQNKGLYIDGGDYRLIYDFSTPHGPQNFRNWYTASYRNPVKDGFENNLHIPFFPTNNLLAPGDESKNYSPDAKVTGRGDTGIWMKWQPVSLNPGETVSYDYLVRLFDRTGSSISAFNTTKSADAADDTLNDNRDKITVSTKIDVVTKFQNTFTDGTIKLTLAHSNADGSIRNDDLKLDTTVSLVD
ncbi:hypothetical protein [Atopobium fossor]|uniref:hypothetical protein n=1 Tax=Atopobium fossor TaxID=39487 RepID=UPI0003F6516B|nr:hypothetical protein [Atopobium fossor]